MDELPLEIVKMHGAKDEVRSSGRSPVASGVTFASGGFEAPPGHPAEAEGRWRGRGASGQARWP
jgi:hypothetical protein